MRNEITYYIKFREDDNQADAMICKEIRKKCEF
jgi:hypothetical protein